jgi:hypothetical protein
LLEREVALLRRLLDNTPPQSERAADVLLRLAFDYQELMLVEKQELHALELQRSCACQRSIAQEALACLVPTEPVG